MNKRLILYAMALLLIFLSGQGVSHANLSDGAVAYYPFNGNANDESGNENDGTVYGATLTEDRETQPDRAYHFNGYSDYIAVPDNEKLHVTGQITMAAWIYIDSYTSNWWPIICKGYAEDAYRFNVYLGKLAIQGAGGGTNHGNIDVPQNQWVHVAATWNGNSLIFYVNGIPDPVSFGFAWNTNNDNLFIGMDPPGLYEYSQGKIDEVRIYNRALSEAEIQELHTGNVSVDDPLRSTTNLIMTKSESSNFATRAYFTALNINHSGVDLALSATGTRTASKATAGRQVYPICDGVVDFTFSGGGLYSFVKVRHPNCNGRDLTAYYGHITPATGLTDVSESTPLGTVKEWITATGNNSHLHLTVDTLSSRDLKSVKYYLCKYTLNSTGNAISRLTYCSPEPAPNTVPRKGQMRLKIGWGQVKTLAYRDASGVLHASSNLYITPSAMQQLGFASFFKLK